MSDEFKHPAPHPGRAMEYRTQDQIRLGMLRFHPELSRSEVEKMLLLHGLELEPGDGVVWIRRAPS